MFLSFLANDAVLPLKLEAFCRNPCRHKILSFLGDSLPVKLHLLVSETTKMWEKQEMLVEISCQKKKKQNFRKANRFGQMYMQSVYAWYGV